jgi:hypothetical protein
VFHCPLTVKSNQRKRMRCCALQHCPGPSYELGKKHPMRKPRECFARREPRQPLVCSPAWQCVTSVTPHDATLQGTSLWILTDKNQERLMNLHTGRSSRDYGIDSPSRIGLAWGTRRPADHRLPKLHTACARFHNQAVSIYSLISRPD